jgi:hypothetical protein
VVPIGILVLCDHTLLSSCLLCRPTVEPTNLLKTLADTNFEAYLKLAQHQDRANEKESQVIHALVEWVARYLPCACR